MVHQKITKQNWFNKIIEEIFILDFTIIPSIDHKVQAVCRIIILQDLQGLVHQEITYQNWKTEKYPKLSFILLFNHILFIQSYKIGWIKDDWCEISAYYKLNQKWTNKKQIGIISRGALSFTVHAIFSKSGYIKKIWNNFKICPLFSSSYHLKQKCMNKKSKFE